MINLNIHVHLQKVASLSLLSPPTPGSEPTAYSPGSANPSAPPASSAYTLSQPTPDPLQASNLYHYPTGPMGAYLAKTPYGSAHQYGGKGGVISGGEGPFPHPHCSLVVLVREAKLLNSLKCLMGVVPMIEERICK